MNRQFILLIFFLSATICKAQKTVEDSLKKVIAAYKNKAAIAKTYNGFAYQYSRKDPVKSRAYIKKAMAIGEK